MYQGRYRQQCCALLCYAGERLFGVSRVSALLDTAKKRGMDWKSSYCVRHSSNGAEQGGYHMQKDKLFPSVSEYPHRPSTTLSISGTNVMISDSDFAGPCHSAEEALRLSRGEE